MCGIFNKMRAIDFMSTLSDEEHADFIENSKVFRKCTTVGHAIVNKYKEEFANDPSLFFCVNIAYESIEYIGTTIDNLILCLNDHKIPHIVIHGTVAVLFIISASKDVSGHIAKSKKKEISHLINTSNKPIMIDGKEPVMSSCIQCGIDMHLFHIRRRYEFLRGCDKNA